MDSRKTLVDDIHRELDLEGDRRYNNKLSAKASHKAYETLTEEDPVPMKGKAWHLRQIKSVLNTDIRKNLYRNTATLPQDALAELRNCLQQQQ